jgi:hypothetical protein
MVALMPRSSKMAAFNLKEAIAEAITALGGSGTAFEVREYIRSKFGRDWKNIETAMDDLSVESESSFFPPEERVLRRMGQGKYSLKEAAISELARTEPSAEEPQTNASEAVYSMLESTLALYSEKLKQILNQPMLKFAKATSKQVPETSGVYVIHDKSSNRIIYAGRSSNLRIRLLQQHRRGNIGGSQFRKALGQKHNLDTETKISSYIIENCSFQLLAVESFQEGVRLEHFITAILAPILNTELKQ